MTFIQNLLEVRERTKIRKASDFARRVRQVVNTFVRDFDKTHGYSDGDRVQFKHLITMYLPLWEPVTITDIDGQEYLYLKINMNGFLFTPKMNISSLYDGDDENIKATLLSKSKKDPTNSQEFKDLVLVVNSLLTHLTHTANLKLVSFGEKPPILARNIDAENFLKDCLDFNGRSHTIEGQISLYMKLPK